MYEFTILVLAGLITAKTVDLVRHVVKGLDHKAIPLVLAVVVGVAYAFLFNFSMFAGWAVAVRAEWIGVMATGLFMAGTAGAWHELLGVLREFAHRYHGEASEIEARLTRAA